MRGLSILLAALLAASSYAGDAPADVATAIAANLKQRYPATHIDQVVDVFYVTDAMSDKVTHDALLDSIRTELVRRIHAFEVG